MEEDTQKVNQINRKGYMLTLSHVISYTVTPGSVVYVSSGQKINKGDIIGKEVLYDSGASKTKDIVQGLPRVEELFEARKPKDSSVLSGISGILNITDLNNNCRVLTVTSDTGEKKEYKIPYKSRVLMSSGSMVAKEKNLLKVS